MTDREVVELQAQRQEDLTLKLRSPTASWTNDQIASKIRSNSALARARTAFHSSMHNINELLQDDGVSYYVIKRLEFQAVIEIAQALGIKVVYENSTSGPGDTANE